MIKWTAPIAFEGWETTDQRIVRPGALTWETPMPLMSDALSLDGFSYPILGTVQEIERDAQGALRATGIIYGSEAPRVRGLAITIDGMELIPPRKGETLLVVTAGRIRAVTVTETPSWTECVFDD